MRVKLFCIGCFQLCKDFPLFRGGIGLEAARGRSPCFIWLVTCRTRDYVFVVPCSWQIEYRYDSLFFLFVCSDCKKWFLWLKATNEFVGPVFSLLQNIEKEQFQDITLPDWEGFKTETRSMRNQLSQQIKHFRKTFMLRPSNSFVK